MRPASEAVLAIKAIRFLVGATAAILVSLPSIATAAPRELYGRSVLVSWSEDRQQKLPGEDEIRNVGAFAELNVYVSEQGRAFSRIRFSVANRKGRMKSGSADAVAGENSARNISFGGSTMTASMPRGSAGALQILVSFDGGFQNCTARVISGKTGGAQATHVRSLINGNRLEMYSVKTSGEACRLQNGNVFGH